MCKNHFDAVPMIFIIDLPEKEKKKKEKPVVTRQKVGCLFYGAILLRCLACFMQEDCKSGRISVSMLSEVTESEESDHIER